MPKEFVWGVEEVCFLIDRKGVLKRPYSKLKFGPFLKLMVEEVVPQKAQQLSEFLSESDG